MLRHELPLVPRRHPGVASGWPDMQFFGVEGPFGYKLLLPRVDQVLGRRYIHNGLFGIIALGSGVIITTRNVGGCLRLATYGI